MFFRFALTKLSQQYLGESPDSNNYRDQGFSFILDSTYIDIMNPNYDYLPEFYKGYVALVSEQPLIAALFQSKERCLTLFKTISEDKGVHTYDIGKWSIKELINHVIDAERVFAYRALTFARNDNAELPGFEENTWVTESKANSRTMENLVGQYEQVSASTMLLFKSFDTEMLNRSGMASGEKFNVANIGFIIAGHETHHANILKERYLK